MRKFSFLACLLVFASLVGCASSANVKLCVFEAGVNSGVHEWRDAGCTFNCDDADPPCRSTVTVGFVTVGSDVTLGGSPDGVNIGLGVTWNSSKDVVKDSSKDTTAK